MTPKSHESSAFFADIKGSDAVMNEFVSFLKFAAYVC